MARVSDKRGEPGDVMIRAHKGRVVGARVSIVRGAKWR